MDETKIVKLLEGYEMPCGSGEYEFIHQKDYQAIAKELLAAINYTRCCKSDSEQLHTEVFKLANKLAINGYGNEAVKMHGICNGM
tara:strand:- start:462 stop:716 length:255 start_codon:yes stop_codon:yes gene_type:complete